PFTAPPPYTLFFSRPRPPPRSTLFPYTTLFRSRCAHIAGQLNVVRCMHTKQSEHLQAINLLTRGNPDRAGFTRPTLGSVISATLEKVDTKIPNYVLLDPNPEGNEFKEYKASDLAGWLGAEFQPVRLGGAYTQLGHSVDAHAQDQEERQALRRFFA